MFPKLTLYFSLVGLLAVSLLAACAAPIAAPIPPTDQPTPTAAPLIQPSATPRFNLPTEEVAPMLLPNNPYAPQPGDKEMTAGNAFVDLGELLASESSPVQYTLTLSGNLPTPCHELRVQLLGPDAENRLKVEVSSISDPRMVCIQVLAPFDVQIPLDGLPSGQYTLWLNDVEPMGNLDIP